MDIKKIVFVYNFYKCVCCDIIIVQLITVRMFLSMIASLIPGVPQAVQEGKDQWKGESEKKCLPHPPRLCESRGKDAPGESTPDCGKGE